MKKVPSASRYSGTRCVCSSFEHPDVCDTSLCLLQWKPTINVATSSWHAHSWLIFDPNISRTVLATIQEKLGNPQPDDPFEPDIAAVGPFIIPRWQPGVLTFLTLATQERQTQVLNHRERMDEEVRCLLDNVTPD